MILNELLGLDAAPGRSKYHRTGKPTGRPTEFKIRARPKKNLWFQDDRLWTSDLDLAHNNDYDLVSTENEEDVVACNKDRSMAYGKWSKRLGRGITFKTPRPMQTVVHPKLRLVDMVGSYPSLA